MLNRAVMNQAWFPPPEDNQSTQIRGEIWRQGSAQAFQGPTNKWAMGLSDALPINTQPQCTSVSLTQGQARQWGCKEVEAEH